jgi:hypothetical protein
VNAHPSYEITTGSFSFDDEDDVSFVKPEGFHVGVTLDAEELADEREGPGEEEEEEDESLGENSPSGEEDNLLEQLLTLSGENDASSLEDSSNTLEIDGVDVNKVSVCKIIFGRGLSKSNDRLKRVRGLGKARHQNDSVRAADPDDEAADMTDVVMPGDVGGAVVATEGTISLCLVFVERLDHGTSKGLDSLTRTELKESASNVSVRLARAEFRGGALLLSGGLVSNVPSIVVPGAEFTPLNHTSSSVDGLFFDLDELAALVTSLPPVSSPPRYSFASPAQHKRLVLDGSIGLAAVAAASLRSDCTICAVSLPDSAQLRRHVAGHWYAGDLGSSSGIATDSCGFCGATIVGQSCLTTALNLDKRATTKLLSNCPLFPGEKMRYGAADKGSKKNPSTNLPVLCQEGGCLQAGVTYWRHNAAGHYARAHAGLAVTTTVSEQ